MDFGIQIEPQFGYSYDDIVAIGKTGERAGFTRLWLSDHLFLDPDAVRTDCLEAWTALAALARDLETIRIGPMVSCQSYRNPALLAKIAAGVDVMSGGRLEFGIGAGWKDVEYKAYGYEFPPAPTRVDELVDTIEICTRMWRDDKATYRGKRYSIDAAPCAPKPLQSPLPIWVGGSKPRVLPIAAKYAHWLNHTKDMTVDSVRRRQEALDAACRDRKRDPKTLKRSAFLSLVVGATPRDVEASVARTAARAGLSADEWRSPGPGALSSSPPPVLQRPPGYARVWGILPESLLPSPPETPTIVLVGPAAPPAP